VRRSRVVAIRIILPAAFDLQSSCTHRITSWAYQHSAVLTIAHIVRMSLQRLECYSVHWMAKHPPRVCGNYVDSQLDSSIELT
jgi:hypothetical protein